MNTEFKHILDESLTANTFIKLTLSDKKEKKQEIKKVLIKLVDLKKGLHICFVYRYDTKDVTKNLPVAEGVAHIDELLTDSFKQALLFTTTNDYHYTTVGKNKITAQPASCKCAPTHSHDKEKARLIKAENNVYLRELGVCTNEGKVRKDMQDKYRQINKYVELLEGALKDLKKSDALSIVDMGAGKGYLTFAMYDYLTNTLGIDTSIAGVELRPNLVKDGNALAHKAGFDKLKFIEGRIEEVELPHIDVLVALHACNTATDDAIQRGITSGAKLIVCSPCCHKQIRQEISKNNQLSAITKHGILKERQAEIITDTIRALILEAYGYKTQVFEFIATEHTPKNVIITALKQEDVETPNADKLKEVQDIKRVFGIEKHYLETILK